MKAEWKTLALEVAKGITPRDAYMTAYPKQKDPHTASAAASRLLKRPDIQAEVARLKLEVFKPAEKKAAQEVAAKVKTLALTQAKRREILYNIAIGAPITAWDRAGKQFKRVPSDADRIRAIELDMEITGEGWRPPEPETPGGQVINNISNTVTRVTIFNTRKTTAQGQSFQLPAATE